MRIPYISLVAAGALALGGCAYGDVGYGVGLGYGDYGNPYYGYGYGSPYYGYGSYGYGGFGSPFGWYDDYYYPGTGIYVYDSYRRPRMWTSRERSYWTTRHRVTSSSSTRVASTTPNWSRFDRRSENRRRSNNP